jgi:hypothetical protein
MKRVIHINVFNGLKIASGLKALGSQSKELAPKLDGADTELLKYDSYKLKYHLIQLFNDVWNTGIIVKEWKQVLKVKVKHTKKMNICHFYMGRSYMDVVFTIK